jgi:hypothetical protein
MAGYLMDFACPFFSAPPPWSDSAARHGPIFAQLLPLLLAVWWPFCRILAMLSAAPVLGDGAVPATVRILMRWCWPS